MTRFVIDAGVGLRLGRERAVPADGHRLVAPTLIRSQMLSALYRQSLAGEVTKREAEAQLDHVRGLRIRLLGDRVSQSVAWKAAVVLGWDDTTTAEYVAVTQLQADAFVTLDDGLADAVRDLVRVAPYDALF